MTAMPVEPALVPNPRRQALQQTLAAVRRHVAQLEAALDQPFGQFTGRAVWVGPAARRFGDDLDAYRRRLRNQARRVLSDLEEEVARTPEKVSPSVARYEAGRLWLAP
ncbi:hypothetical protein Misp01_35630 [Microtetraspora sp. NBRC 13810]|uniref:hypothetical protein n=1 Tax=Microtetraspora sp. NBRC 13810 TaxID=3030990 RepID=UPI0024A07AC9|nr:hypothetical protein [Microtetraspora sp. NBRC 13810]GLW08433.1 hypothetical protein Misp01_35630 [Microtetraspora sp. NBRC 13810]